MSDATSSAPRDRHTDVEHRTPATPPPPSPIRQVLPPVPWAAIGRAAPTRIPLGARHPDDPLPAADIVVVTWTSAEWFALDHVFLNGDRPGDFTGEHGWKHAWLPYTRGAAGFTPDPKSGALWGSFQLVRIDDRSGRPWRVLLFKSSSHLAHPPWIDGLSAMVRALLADTGADRIYTIGTAGGARPDQRLGDSVITNAALLDLGRPQNTGDADNGAMVRCASWFPSTSLLAEVERGLLFRLDEVATRATLTTLLGQVQAKHPDDPAVRALTLDDLTGDALRPESLGQPRIAPMPDVPLLTTDFYYIASGDRARAYSFLEMDDAVIAREANRAGARFACVRNISDPIVPAATAAGAPIADGVRGDWSAAIYTSFGLFTSYNGALATWATIAGDGADAYDPPRDVDLSEADDPLEVKLAYQVRACGSCELFWPRKKTDRTYGPYTAFDFDVDVPYAAAAGAPGGGARPWVSGRTRPPAFPNGEVIDGCRKAPIMTIGINPNLTAFSPGQTGAAWAYPDFSSDNGTDAWTKYAWYYRYRTVYQEKLPFDFARRFVLPEGRVLAPRPGRVVSASRPDDKPTWSMTVRFDGDPADTHLELPGTAGDFPYVMLFDSFPPHDRFAAGDVLAGRIAVPAGIRVEVLQQPQGYYLQFVPVLERLQASLRAAGHAGAELRVGEDVAQLDMVACASPHWNPGFLGGSDAAIATIVDNCVSKHAWAVKQLVQTRPAVLYVVSISSWHMFHDVLGAHVTRDVPLSTHPADHDFTLLRETTDPAHPAYLDLDVTVDGQRYRQRTRLVVTPHFSYNTNFVPQLRIAPADWARLEASEPACVAAMTAANGLMLVRPPADRAGEYTVVQLSADPARAQESLAVLKAFPSAWELLAPGYYDPHAQMASVLDQLVAGGELAWKDTGDGRGHLARTEGSCRFCVNRHWQFPGECRYDKAKEPAPAPGFLEKVAAEVIATGRPSTPPRPEKYPLTGTPLFVVENS